MGNPLSDSEGEASEDNSMRPDIIDGFERKSVALLDYVNNLEAQLEQLRTSFDLKESRLKADKKALEEELALRDGKLASQKRALDDKIHSLIEQSNRTQKALLQEERKRMASDEVIRNLKLDVRATQDLLHNERQRAKELEEQLTELKEQLRSKEQTYNRRRLKDEREKTKLEEDMTVLRKKVTLGWILGCLTEVYLRLENENDAQKGKGSGCFKNNTRKPAKLESIEREVRKLTNCQESPHSHKKRHVASPRQVLEQDSISGSENELDMDISPIRDALSTNNSCKPCRFLRSLEPKLDHHHRPRSVSPTSSAL